MNPDLPGDAVEFGRTARRAFEAAGGVDAARRAEAAPATRADVAALLGVLGIDDLDPRSDPEVAAASAVLCAEAGRVALPYPVAGLLLRGSVGDDAGRGLPVALTPRGHARVDHGDLFDEWLVIAPDRTVGTARAEAPPLGSRLGPFACDLTMVDGSHSEAPIVDPDSVQRWWLALSAWTILGAVDRAVELATQHASERIQFGKPLTAFQTVRFQLADAAIAVAGLRELAVFTLWRLDVDPDGSWPDVLALRSHALDVARAVLRSTQQLHGATGLCDEADISILIRHLQPTLRLPAGAEDAASQLASAIAVDGFDGLFPHGSAA